MVRKASADLLIVVFLCAAPGASYALEPVVNRTRLEWLGFAASH